MAKNGQLHEGHRERMRQRFLAEGGQHFQDHELLEMLLFYTNARADTNDTAHALMEAFGALDTVLEANTAELCAVSGVGEKSAFLIKLLNEISRRYAIAKLSPEEKTAECLQTIKQLVDFFAPRFLGVKNEQAYALLVDNSMRPLDCFPVGDGTVTSLTLSVRYIAERAYTKHAAAVFLAHNHPLGMAVPSSDDIATTHRVKEALSILEIPLLEHFIFAGNSFTTVLRSVPRDIIEPAVAASPIFDLHKKRFEIKKGEKK